MNSQTISPARINQLIAGLQSTDDAVRGEAWQGAAALGAAAIQPVSHLVTHPNFEVARAAKRALWKIVRYAGRPKAASERKAVQTELIALLQSAPQPVQREALWMLSEIGDTRAVKPISQLLAHPALREDARCALERIPVTAATRALQNALQTAPEDFRSALAHSLRVRGRPVEGYPSQKLIPTKTTTVKPN